MLANREDVPGCEIRNITKRVRGDSGASGRPQKRARFNGMEVPLFDEGTTSGQINLNT